ncbi:hypothetical protein CDD80_7213 [Ophiocordyceps camponoti-rufipedis]|uniref:Protein SQS1 n=1 Tax=Ophiocordyceps camponoti-rufipedis TaxID=2004952 RepID=A0A2C5YJ99_9HYPO|nr:hypothetical protein CDD80_7213 [Ophiocordyceps camponoti-rufipedis]
MRDHGFASDTVSHESPNSEGTAITSRNDPIAGNCSLNTSQQVIPFNPFQEESNLRDAETCRLAARPLAEKDSEEESLVHLIAAQCLDTGPDRQRKSQPSHRRPKKDPKAVQHHRQTKSRGSNFPSLPEGFDLDLEENLRASWNKDRLKKKHRKKQREEFRSMGLLGRHSKQNDLWVKYPHGMDSVQITEEVKTFLQKTQETITFPPLDLRYRKFIHELANQFGVKSKSVGGTDQRRPILSRTSKTLPYVESRFEQALVRLRRREFTHIKRTQVSNPMLQNLASTSYQDGEIVGATAPALGVENRGRVMLERMGWCNGTALGAPNNKGILQPVTHTMRRNKAGLQ